MNWSNYFSYSYYQTWSKRESWCIHLQVRERTPILYVSRKKNNNIVRLLPYLLKNLKFLSLFGNSQHSPIWSQMLFIWSSKMLNFAVCLFHNELKIRSLSSTFSFISGYYLASMMIWWCSSFASSKSLFIYPSYFSSIISQVRIFSISAIIILLFCISSIEPL